MVFFLIFCSFFLVFFVHFYDAYLIRFTLTFDGPNDVSKCVVWAQDKCFSDFFLISLSFCSFFCSFFFVRFYDAYLIRPTLTFNGPISHQNVSFGPKMSVFLILF